MEAIVVNNVESLYLECKEHRVSVYGAKTVALRACYYLESRGVAVDSFLVSNRYRNPDMLRNKQVNRIEETTGGYDCVVIAVSAAFIWEVEAELQKYEINKLVLINPVMDDDFPISCLLSEGSKVSNKVFLSEKIQMVADETSRIIVDDNVMIGEGTIILATDYSYIHIGKGTNVGGKSLISAENNSSMVISEMANMGEKSHIRVKNNARIEIKEKSLLDSSNILAVDNSEIQIGENAFLGSEGELYACEDSQIIICERAIIKKLFGIGATRSAQIKIGKGSTFGSCLSMASDKSSVNIGDDSMFSSYVKANTGGHKLINCCGGVDITNRKPIIIGNHVWVGMGVALLPGCEVGEHSVIGASSVVTKKIPAHVTCAGNPARVMRENIDWERDELK